MNKQHLTYFSGKLLNSSIGIVSLAGLGLSSYNLSMSIQFQKWEYLLAEIPMIALFSTGAIYSGLDSLGVFLSKRELCKNPDEYLFQDYEDIVFEDVEGLEKLLKETNEKRKKEWGTFSRYSQNDSTAVVHEVLESKKSEERDYVVWTKRTAILLDRAKANQDGFNSAHHYHPFGNAMNFSINSRDKVNTKGEVNFLTFMFKGEPEIIGYNLQHVYLPEDRSKHRLVRASFKDIMTYLGK